MALFVVIMSVPFGFVNFVLVFTAVFLVAAMVGTWLFYVQDQFDGVYWRRHEDWDLAAAVLSASSPGAAVGWCSASPANIGLHHNRPWIGASATTTWGAPIGSSRCCGRFWCCGCAIPRAVSPMGLYDEITGG